MSHGRHRASFDQVYEFYRGRIVAYKDCELSFVNVLDETTQLCDAVLASMDAGKNDGADRTHLVALLPMMADGLCTWHLRIVQKHHEP
ncbi:hypothetical protein TNCV_3005041 [Trichonephila clavipes]|nr:hypothetical protein TNCV_3005041 [Trichonephila clavipes]